MQCLVVFVKMDYIYLYGILLYCQSGVLSSMGPRVLLYVYPPYRVNFLN
jgi:hypothetical protein